MKEAQLELPGSQLELAMQELEPMEAPGWATGIGASLGATLVSAASYVGYTISASIITT